MNNIIITGVPRSGTSLLCELMSRIYNVYTFNEIRDKATGIDFYNIPALPGMFETARERIIANAPVPQRHDRKGLKTTNTMKDGQEILHTVERAPNMNYPVFIGSKINAPYLFNLDLLAFNRFKIVVIVRDPVYVIGSYNAPWTQTLNIANCLTDPRYQHMQYDNEYWKLWEEQNEKGDIMTDEDTARAKIYCQAEIIGSFYDVIERVSDFSNCLLVRYEGLTEKPKLTLRKIAGHIGSALEHCPDNLKFENKNDLKRYGIVDGNIIKDAVEKYCGGRFGY